MLISNQSSLKEDFKKHKLTDLKEAVKILAKNTDSLEYFKDGTVLASLKGLEQTFTSDFIAMIKELKLNQDEIGKIYSNLSIIKEISPMMDNINTVVGLQKELKESYSYIEKIRIAKNESCLATERTKGFYMRSQIAYWNIYEMYHKMLPKVNHVDKVISDALVVAQENLVKVEAGHLRAKYAYDSDVYIEMERMCIDCSSYTTYKDPEYHPDGTIKLRGSIVHHLPEPVCYNVIDTSKLELDLNANQIQVNEAVNKYFVVNPPLGGAALTQEEVDKAIADAIGAIGQGNNNGGGSPDEPITQAEADKAVAEA